MLPDNFKIKIVNTKTEYFKLLFIRALFLFVSLITFAPVSYSQDITANATLDKNNIKIGQQAKITLQLTHPKSQKIDWITIPDTITKLEIVNQSKIDTVPSIDSNHITRKQTLIITGFDSGYYPIPPFVFNYKKSNDTTTYSAETEAMLFTVNTIPVDTTKAIKDIKGTVEVALTWKDFLPYIIGIIVLGAGIWFFLYMRKKSRMNITETKPWIPKRPAHEIALEDLKQLSEEKLWQQGNFKGYHTRLTDIIRLYIAYRWQINAPEMTTDEILNTSVIRSLGNETIEILRQLLVLADLVKFAKVQPLSSENELSISQAFEFVNRTRPVTEEMQKEKEAKS